jgi:hypothetical protein
LVDNLSKKVDAQKRHAYVDNGGGSKRQVASFDTIFVGLLLQTVEHWKQILLESKSYNHDGKALDEIEVCI